MPVMLKGDLEADASRGPGYGVITIDQDKLPPGTLAGELAISIQSNQGQKYLGTDGLWQATQAWHRLTVDGVTTRQGAAGGGNGDETVLLPVGPELLDPLMALPPNCILRLQVQDPVVFVILTRRAGLLSSGAASRGAEARPGPAVATTIKPAPEPVSAPVPEPVPQPVTAPPVTPAPVMAPPVMAPPAMALPVMASPAMPQPVAAGPVIPDPQPSPAPQPEPAADPAPPPADAVPPRPPEATAPVARRVVAHPIPSVPIAPQPGQATEPPPPEALPEAPPEIPAESPAAASPPPQSVPEAAELSTRDIVSGNRMVPLVIAAGILFILLVAAAGGSLLLGKWHTASAPPPVAPLPAQASPAAAPPAPARLASREDVARLIQTTPDIPAALAAAQQLMRDGKLDLAMLVYQYAARAGSAEADIALARMYDPQTWSTSSSPMPAADAETAAYWYEPAAKGGSVEAQRQLGKILVTLNPSGPQREKGRKWLGMAARAGDTEAASLLSTLK